MRPNPKRCPETHHADRFLPDLESSPALRRIRVQQRLHQLLELCKAFGMVYM